MYSVYTVGYTRLHGVYTMYNPAVSVPGRTKMMIFNKLKSPKASARLRF